MGSGLRAGAGPACPRAPREEGRGGAAEGGREAGKEAGAGWGGGEGKAPRVLPEERRRRSGGSEGGGSAGACHVPSLAPGASCTASPRKSTGKWQTGLTGFTRSSLDTAAHYHNRLQRRRRSAPAAAGTCRDPRPPPPTGPPGRDPRRCAPAAALEPSPKRTRGRHLPADPAVRAGLSAGRGGGEPGRAEGEGRCPPGASSRGPGVTGWPGEDPSEAGMAWGSGHSCARRRRGLFPGLACAGREPPPPPGLLGPLRLPPARARNGPRGAGAASSSGQQLGLSSAGTGGSALERSPELEAAALGRWAGKGCGCQGRAVARKRNRCGS